MSDGVDYLRTLYAMINDKYLDAQAESDRRLALLKQYDKNKKVCMFCNTRYHTDDCELAKELADDT